MQKLSEIFDTPKKWGKGSMKQTIGKTTIEFDTNFNDTGHYALQREFLSVLCLMGGIHTQTGFIDTRTDMLNKDRSNIPERDQQLMMIMAQVIQEFYPTMQPTHKFVGYDVPGSALKSIYEELYKVILEPTIGQLRLKDWRDTATIISRFNDHKATTFEDVQRVIDEYDRRVMLAGLYHAETE